MFKISRISKIAKNEKKNHFRRRFNKNSTINRQNLTSHRLNRKVSFGSMKDELSLESIHDQLQQLKNTSCNSESSILSSSISHTKKGKTDSMCLDSRLFENPSEKESFENFQISQGCFFVTKQTEQLSKDIQNIKNVLIPDE